MASIEIRHGHYGKVLEDVSADLIVTSPPYNIGSKSKRIDGRRASGLYDPKSYGAIRDYPDELPEMRYQEEQSAFLGWAADHLKINGVLVYNHKPRRRDGAMIHPAEWFLNVPRLTLVEEVIWDRGSTHNHCNNLMWPQTERLYVFRRADGKYKLHNHAKLEQRSDIWRINPAKANGHNAPFPEKLAEAIIGAWSKKGDLVVDPYCGSGTAAVAAKKLGRRFIGSEILEKYWKLAVKRATYGEIGKC